VTALLAMALSLGMQADYAALIEKHQLESLRMIREADEFAKKLLAVNPDAADAYLTLGAANYIIGSVPVIKRFFLRFKGIRGDKPEGIQQLEIAAEMARTQLIDLVAEFPANPLFSSELMTLGASPDSAVSPPKIRNRPHGITGSHLVATPGSQGRLSSPGRRRRQGWEETDAGGASASSQEEGPSENIYLRSRVSES
jgi:hypothetical protein